MKALIAFKFSERTPADGNSWNQALSPTTTGQKFANMVSSTGAATGWSLNLLARFENAVDMGAGEYSAVWDDEMMRDYARVGVSNPNPSIRISGLNITKTYKIDIVARSTTASGATNTATVNGVVSPTYLQYSTNSEAARTLTLVGIAPNGSGQIDIVWSSSASNSSVVNVMSIEEEESDTDAPDFTDGPDVDAIGESTATIAATSNETGTAAVIATSLAADPPSNAAFDASAFTSVIAANTPFAINVTGLPAGQLQRFWVQIKDSASSPNRTTSSVIGLTTPTGFSRITVGTPNLTAARRIEASPDAVTGEFCAWGNIQGSGTVIVYDNLSYEADAAVTAFGAMIGNLTDGWGDEFTQTVVEEDVNAPQFSVAAAIANLLETSWSITGESNEAGEVAVIVTSPAASQPTDAAFDASIERATIAANTPFSIDHSGADPDTEYTTWVQIKDLAGLRATASISVQTPAEPDTIAPNFIVAMSITAIAQTTASFSATPDESGVYGLVVLESAAAAPAESAILAGSVSGALYSRPQTNMTATIAITAALNGMAAGQSYRLHAVLQDEDGNSRIVSSSPFTTAVAPDSQAPNVIIGVITAASIHTFTATPTDNIGVVGVQFYINDLPVGAELTQAPWQFVWDESVEAAGDYVVTAVARDGVGLSGTSNAILISVIDDDIGQSTSPLASGGPALYKPEGSVWRRIQER